MKLVSEMNPNAEQARESQRSLAASSASDVENMESAAGASARVGAHRIANSALLVVLGFIFIAPNAIFAFALKPAPAAAVLLGCAIAAYIVARRPAVEGASLLASAIDVKLLAGCAALSLALCLLGGEGHFFYANTDWLTRDAVLADLVTQASPVGYRYEGQDYLLRAPLGMYMTPTLVGRMFGLHAAHMAMLTQNSAAVAVMLYLLAKIAAVRSLPFLALFVLFSGLDIVPVFVFEATRFLQSKELLSFSHIEWWGQYWWNIPLQYSSHITQLFWVPNHMLAGWWFATLALLYMRKEVDIATLIVTFAALLMWSPLSMLGAIPFLAVFGLKLLPGGLFERRTLIAAAGALLFLPVAVYLTLDAASVAHQFLPGVAGFGMLYVVFLMVEIPQTAVIAIGWSKIDSRDRWLVAGAIALLVVIPVYSFGPSNDFAMRASIMPLFLLAFGFARIAVLTPRDNSALPTFVSVLVILAFATPMLELKRAFLPAYAVSDCNVLTTWRKDDISTLPTNYWARVEKIPKWLSAVSSAPLSLEERKCWPDHPLLPEKSK
jgi:hypothetical protein